MFSVSDWDADTTMPRLLSDWKTVGKPKTAGKSSTVAASNGKPKLTKSQLKAKVQEQRTEEAKQAELRMISSLGKQLLSSKKEKEKEKEKDKGPLPAEGTSMFTLPPCMSHEFDLGVTAIPFLRPTKDMKPPQDGPYAIRGNAKYVNVVAAYNGERAYVRIALDHAETILFYPSPGKYPITIVGKFQPDPIPIANIHPSDAVSSRTRVIQPRVKKTKIDVQFDLPSHSLPFHRCTIPDTEIEKFKDLAAKMIPESELGFRSGPIPNWTTILLRCSPDHAAHFQAAGVPVFMLSDVCSDARRQSLLSIRCREKLNDAELRAFQLKTSKFATHSMVKGFNAIRIATAEPVTIDLISKLRQLLGNRYVVSPDIFISAWAKRDRNDNGNDDAVNDSETAHPPTSPGKIRRHLKADYVCNHGDFQKVATAIRANIVALGTSKFTDTVMTALVEFEANEEAHVSELESTTIETPFGNWYVTSRNSDV